MSVGRVFVDTSAWVALQVPNDPHHEAALEALPRLLSKTRALVTSNLVIAETYTLLRGAAGHPVARRFLDRTAPGRDLEVRFVERDVEARAYELLDQYAEHTFSYVDATSFALMRSRRLRHAFAFDQHFATAGFLRIPADVPVDQL